MPDPIAHALIEDGIVTNLILIGEDYEDPPGTFTVPAPDGVSIGHTYADGIFTPPEA